MLIVVKFRILLQANQAERSKKRQKKPSLPYFHLNSEENLLDFCKRVDVRFLFIIVHLPYNLSCLSIRPKELKY